MTSERIRSGRRRGRWLVATLAAVLLVPESSTVRVAAEADVTVGATAFENVADGTGLHPARRMTPPTPAPAPAPAPADGDDLDVLADEVIRLTNVERVEAGLPSLSVHPSLVTAATTHAIDQRERPCRVGYLTHTGTDGSNAADRILRTGLSIRRWAENIACAFRSPDALVRGWMGSPGHSVNILNPDLTHIGVAVTESSTGQRYWVQVFGTLR